VGIQRERERVARDLTLKMNDDESDFSDSESIDSCEEYIYFKSIRNPSTQLEEAISFSWPGIYEDDGKDGNDTNDKIAAGEEEKKLKRILVSTLLEEDDLAPLFDGSRWAGTRLWGAAVRCIQYMAGHLPDSEESLSKHGIEPPNADGTGGGAMLELGCGLGVPAMIYHLLGGGTVLTDQAEILSQLEKNVMDNFPKTAITSANAKDGSDLKKKSTIQAMPLSWSRTDINDLLQQLGRSSDGFDIVINCDCVYEPLYGKR